MSTFGLCPYCGKTKPSENGTGKDVACCGEVGHGTVIRTSFDYPPIPYRGADWSAVTADYCGCGECHSPQGHGATEEEAIADLLEQLEEIA